MNFLTIFLLIFTFVAYEQAGSVCSKKSTIQEQDTQEPEDYIIEHIEATSSNLEDFKRLYLAKRQKLYSNDPQQFDNKLIQLWMGYIARGVRLFLDILIDPTIVPISAGLLKHSYDLYLKVIIDVETFALNRATSSYIRSTLPIIHGTHSNNYVIQTGGIKELGVAMSSLDFESTRDDILDNIKSSLPELCLYAIFFDKSPTIIFSLLNEYSFLDFEEKSDLTTGLSQFVVAYFPPYMHDLSLFKDFIDHYKTHLPQLEPVTTKEQNLEILASGTDL